MGRERPSPAEVWRAVDAYLAAAYDGPPPADVAGRLARLRAVPDEAFYACDVLERSEDRCALRLGNRFYQHMKLVIETPADGPALFRADTHDRHVLDLAGRDDPRFAELMERNQSVARAIEAAWSACGLRTTREHWRDEVARWQGSRR